MIPKQFTERMRDMLGGEYAAFEESYQRERYQALRVNPRKVGGDQARLPFHLTKVLWEPDGFYYGSGDHPGRHPYHDAGLYYIQEPSAMLPARLLDVAKGERVLDLCAAPGGKSTQLGAALDGAGLLVSNEIHPARAKVLSENIERMGIGNALVLNETPQRLAEVFGDYFDKILVDAPCSGEGMFRKNEDAVKEWSLENVRLCAKRQDEILDCAAGMLRLGGRMVYSTCTFAPEENEGSVGRFLQRHPEFEAESIPLLDGMSRGFSLTTDETRKAVRLWPHRVKGEGHFAAVLRKTGDTERGARAHPPGGEESGGRKEEYKSYLEFEREYLRKKIEGKFLSFGEQLYLIPEATPLLRGLKVLRPGLHLGTLKKNRFEPSHALALALCKEEARFCCNLEAQGSEIKWYLGGQTFPWEGGKGWHLITVDGYSVGWGKLAGGVMKNHYPKGLRRP